MLEQSLNWISRKSPGLKRKFWQTWYQLLSRTFQDAEVSFLNYGYADSDEACAPLALRPEDERNRYCIQLYHRVASAVDLTGQRVLEVGSGRGGGCSYIARYLGPESVCGVDFSPKAVAYCRRVHNVDTLTFEPGDAEALSSQDARFDAVVNVESSHCYGSMESFLSEAARVLRPGGSFLWADLRAMDRVPVLRDQFRAAGFQSVEEEEITANVLRAMDLEHERKRELILTHVPKLASGAVGAFAGLKGSGVYEGLRTGATVYLRCVLTKAG